MSRAAGGGARSQGDLVPETTTIASAEDMAAPLSARARDVLSLAKPRLSALVIVTGGGALWLSGRPVPVGLALSTLVGLTLVVSAANALNNYLERDTDRYMSRTRGRPLPAGRMDPSLALWLGVLLAPLSIGLLTWGANPLAGLLATVAFLSYVLVYTPLKRRSHLSIVVGAVPGALPPLIGWTAATGELGLGGLSLFAVLFFWQIPHSIAIGIYRKSEYAAAGIKVLPLVLGDARARRWTILTTVMLVGASLTLVPAGVGDTITLAGSVMLGLAFLGRTLRRTEPGQEGSWARGVFLDSLLYLTALFGVLALDRWL